MDFAAALSPKQSVVVEACAGSGKTWLLVSRIIRLLLDGVKPSEILAITFTRKAAQEMQLRLRDWLYDLATKDDDFVTDFLRQRAVTEQELVVLLPRARLLYQQFLLAQPNITLSTFHGWFVQLLQRAPINAGVAGSTQLAEHTEFLLEEAWLLWLEQLTHQTDSPAATSVEYLFETIGLDNTQQLLYAFIDKRSEWWVLTQGQDDAVVFAQQSLLEEFELDLDADPYVLCLQNPLLFEYIGHLAALHNGTAAQHKKAENLLGLLHLDLELEAYFNLLWDEFFTQKDTLRSFKAVASKGQNQEDFDAALSVIAELLQRAKDQITAMQIYWQNYHGLNCAVSLLDVFQRLKQQQQMLDFGDLEWRVYQLLKQSDDAAFLLAKLDSRYRHVLLDEFQDTNPLQWQILQAWFQAAAEVQSAPIVFLVGDPKQSIYRFRRADARLFDAARQYLQQEFSAVYLSQNTTRRNAPAILQVVNKVFSDPDEYAGFVHHEAFQQQLVGYVHCLPLTDSVTSGQPDSDQQSLVLRNPLLEAFQESEDLSRQLEAEQFAEWVSQIVGHYLVDDEGQQRPARYSDVMVLVRRRTYLQIYEQALRKYQIPYLSSRRGGLLESLEALDIQALLTFLMTPLSDLNLAQVLRSPIFSCDDQELLQLCTDESESSGLWYKLQTRVDLPARLLRAKSLLQNWLPLAEHLPVHDLLDHIYFEADVVNAYAQTVPEGMVQSVLANLQAFLEIALNIDAGRYPSLPAFLRALQELQDASNNVSPDEGQVSHAGDAMRIYTVHESKGLEAPIVCLLDSNTTREMEDRYQVLVDWSVNAERPGHFSLYGDKASRGQVRAKYFATEAQLAKRENLNLLYVAMTRAKQLLLVSGNGKFSDESWYGRIQSGIPSEAMSLPLLESGFETVDHVVVVDDNVDAVWHRPMPTGQKKALKTESQQYGIWLHATLEQLLEQESDSGLLDLNFIPVTEREAVLTHAQQILSKSELKRFFDASCYIRASNELALVDCSGQLKRIDRLVEFEQEVWILDYKSGNQVLLAYQQQLDEYGQALSSLYPNKVLCKALIMGNGKLIEC